MKKLGLRLSSEGGQNFSIVLEKGIEESSILPFFHKNDSKLSTIFKILNNFEIQLNPEEILNNFEVQLNPEEKQWMIEDGLLNNEEVPSYEVIVKRVGQRLFDSLFINRIKRAFDQAYGETRNDPLHIQITYQHDEIQKSKISLYPWHLIYDDLQDQFLVKENRLIFSYLIAHPDAQPNLIKKEKTTIILISSDASDPEKNLKPIESSESEIQKGLELALSQKYVKIQTIYNKKNHQRPTFIHLQQQLQTYKPHNDYASIIHFDGHSVFKKYCSQCFESSSKLYPTSSNICENDSCKKELMPPQGFLLFQKENGEPEYIRADRFADLVWLIKPVLVVITACRSAQAYDSNSVFNGIAQKLIQKGVPAVVGFPFQVSDDSARGFIESFYRVLLSGKKSLLEAVSQGSKAMRHFDKEWYRPIIFMRHEGVEDGYLFTFSATFPEISKSINSSNNYPLRFIKKKNAYDSTSSNLISTLDYIELIKTYKNCCFLSKEVKIVIDIFESGAINDFKVYRNVIKTISEDLKKIPNPKTPPEWLNRIYNFVPLTDDKIKKYNQAYKKVKTFIAKESKRTSSFTQNDADNFASLMEYNGNLEIHFDELKDECSRFVNLR